MEICVTRIGKRYLKTLVIRKFSALDFKIHRKIVNFYEVVLNFDFPVVLLYYALNYFQKKLSHEISLKKSTENFRSEVKSHKFPQNF